MTPAQVERYREAQATVRRLQQEGAGAVRQAYAAIFGGKPEDTHGTPPSSLIHGIARELQARAARAAMGITRVKVVRRVGKPLSRADAA